MPQRQFRSDDTSLWGEKYGGGADGSLTISADTTQAVANAGCSGTAATKNLTIDAASSFANGDFVIIHQSRGSSAGAWEINRIASGAGTTSLVMTYDLMNTYTDSGADQAQILKIPQYTGLTVNSSTTWSAPAWDGNKGGILAAIVNGAVTINGTISAKGKGFRGSTNGGSPGVGTAAGQGEGTAGDRNTGSTAANGNGGGGGGNTNNDGSLSASGGGGGHASAGSDGIDSDVAFVTKGSGGGSAGNAGLTTLVFGGGGGSGGANGNSSGGVGGEGGGIVILICVSLAFGASGAIDVGGNNGGNSSNANVSAGGAGGAGACLIKSQVPVLGTNKITALGGSGGTSSAGGRTGGNGSNGRNHADYGITISGTTNPTLDSRLDSALNTNGGAFLFLVT